MRQVCVEQDMFAWQCVGLCYPCGAYGSHTLLLFFFSILYPVSNLETTAIGLVGAAATSDNQRRHVSRPPSSTPLP
jgi:hypothetical protein